MINEKVIVTLKNIKAGFETDEWMQNEVKVIDEAIKIIENQKSVIEELEYLKADIRFHGFYNERIEDLIDKHIATLKGE